MKLISPRQLKKLGVLGMNARNIDYVAKLNPRHHYPLVDNKLLTKQAATKLGMCTPELYGVIEIQHQIAELHNILGSKNAFVIKPAQGSGGKGILVIENSNEGIYTKPSGEQLTLADLQRHASNIISGLYSLGGRNDVAMIEALIEFDPLLLQYSYEGVPDTRIIVYQGVPVMAMLRCSTHSSDGKANLHQGAVGVGINMANGHCQLAVQNGALIAEHPDTGHRFDDLQLPHWQKSLELAASCYEMTNLGYFGADIVLDKHKGSTILELNARPGLAIQIANQVGLKKRLSVIDNLNTKAISTKTVNTKTVNTKTMSAKQRAEFSQENFAD